MCIESSRACDFLLMNDAVTLAVTLPRTVCALIVSKELLDLRSDQSCYALNCVIGLAVTGAALACVLGPGGYTAVRSHSNSKMLTHPAREQVLLLAFLLMYSIEILSSVFGKLCTGPH